MTEIYVGTTSQQRLLFERIGTC